jgi:ribokinase
MGSLLSGLLSAVHIYSLLLDSASRVSRRAEYCQVVSISAAASSVPLVVVGSANLDYTVVVERHPLPGETLLSTALTVGTGGKGANQAAAAARSGARPVFVGAVGTDPAGTGLLDNLSVAGVDVSHVARTTSAPTGIALITVAADGENTIVVAAGANATLDPARTAEIVAQLVAPGTVVLSQLEIPLPVLVAVARTGGAHGARLVLNLSPWREIPDDLLAYADPLVVNETEAAAVWGRPIDSADDAASAENVAANAAVALLARSRSVVITLGGDGVVVADGSGVVTLPARRVPVVDTTGAGDAFAGALAAGLAAGASLVDAVGSGIHAGSIAVQYLGAQPPIGFVGV